MHSLKLTSAVIETENFFYSNVSQEFALLVATTYSGISCITHTHNIFPSFSGRGDEVGEKE